MTILSEIFGAMQALVEKTARRVVAINAGGRCPASGILWRPDLIVTADEAFGDEEDAELLMPDGRKVVGRLAGRDPSTDIALLRAESAFDSLDAFKQATTVKTGQLAVAVGRTGNGEQAASGIVKECGGSWRSWAGGLIDRRILLDLTLDRPSHGGAVIDAEGDLIGLAAFAPRRRALVIPAETIDRIAERLATTGSVSRGYLGVGLHPFRHGEQRSGAIVVRLDDNGPARRAGILVGDIVTAWNGEPIRGARDVFTRLGPDTVGSTVTLDLIRANQQTRIDIAVGERPHN
jgi:S1-C subfamily serine protease